MIKRLAAALAALGLVAVLGVTAASASAAIGNIRIGGVAFSSLGKSGADSTSFNDTGTIVAPGVEAVILLNYGHSAKNLKDYKLRDKAGNTILFCLPEKNCADGQDSDEAIVLPPRSQTLVNVERLFDGPKLNNGGDTLYLIDPSNVTVSTFTYKVS